MPVYPTLIELGESIDTLEPFEPITKINDLIAVIWLSEKYSLKVTPEKINLWMKFEKLYTETIISSDESVNHYSLSNFELALLYDSILHELKRPDLNILFEHYPLPEELKIIARPHFRNNAYSTAVFESIKKFNEMIQKKTGLINKSEDALLKATMSNIGNPKNLMIIFNDFINEQSGKNEQYGLYSISKGIFYAFRHPKGHKPDDHPLIQIDAYDALDQLITIGYIWKRIEKAAIQKTK